MYQIQGSMKFHLPIKKVTLNVLEINKGGTVYADNATCFVRTVNQELPIDSDKVWGK